VARRGGTEGKKKRLGKRHHASPFKGRPEAMEAVCEKEGRLRKLTGHRKNRLNGGLGHRLRSQADTAGWR